MTPLGFVLLGLASGSLIAALGGGIVVVRRATGVLSLAHGAIAMWGAYVYSELSQHGRVYLPLFGLPGGVKVANRVPMGAALAVAVLSAALLGGLIQLLVLRRMSRVSSLGKMIATLGVMLAVQGMAVIYFGPGTVQVGGLLPNGTISVGGVDLSVDRLWLVAVVVAVVIVIVAWYRWSELGLAASAAGDSPEAVFCIGLSSARLALVSWVISGAVAGLLGALAAPAIGLAPDQYPLLVVPALAAAFVGRLRRLGWTSVAGLAIGCGQSFLQYPLARGWIPSWGRHGLEALLPLVVMLAAMPRTTLGTAQPGSDLPPAPSPRAPLTTPVVALVGGTALVLGLHGDVRLGVVLSVAGALACLSVTVLAGLTGQLSLAPAAFAGVAAFATSKLTAGGALSFPWGPLAGVTIAAGLGCLVALASARLSRDELAVASLAFAVAVTQVVFNNTALLNRDQLAPLPPPRLFGVGLSPFGRTYPQPVFAVGLLIVLAGVLAGVAVLARSTAGKRMVALRDSERAALSSGIGVTAHKVGAFAVSSLIAGIAGVAISYLYGEASSASFDVPSGLAIVALAYVGGLSTMSGPVVGGVLVSGGLFYVGISHAIHLGDAYLVLTGLGLVLTTMRNPQGLAMRLEERLARFRPGVGA